MGNVKYWRWIGFTVLLWCVPILAQQNDGPPIIAADNISHLQSVNAITFAEGFIVPSKNAEHPEPFTSLHEFDTGWFAINDVADTFVVLDRDKTLIPLIGGGIFTYFAPLTYDDEELASTTLIDAAFIDSFLAILYYTEGATYLSYDTLTVYGGWYGDIQLPAHIEAKSVWGDCPTDEDAFSCRAWIEAALPNEQYKTVVMSMPTVGEVVQDLVSVETHPDIITSHPYVPADDPDAVVRIGRIHPPYVVTSSLEGIVKLLNIQTRDVVAEVDNGTGEPSVFGNINQSATHLAWRDNANENLYLLDFETGENRKIADLDGSYMQFMFLTHKADVILAVNLDLEPHVYVWDVATGEHTDLGPYRECNRVPDMVRLSEDGTTLVIGCDTGLDIWRVGE